MYPVRIYQDRYGGSHSGGGGWVAVDMKNRTMEVPEIEKGILGDDIEAMEFWVAVKGAKWIASGPTPNDALAALEARQDRPARQDGPARLTLITKPSDSN
jgi:hypothetical protein